MIWVNLIFSLTQGCLDFVFQVLLLKAFCSPLKKKMKKKKKETNQTTPPSPSQKTNQTHKPATTTTAKNPL